MVEGIEPYYQRIADGMVESLPDRWHRAWVDTLVYDGGSKQYGCYQTAEDGKQVSFVVANDALDAITEMRTLFVADGKPPWGRARFTLEHTGKCKLDLSYDDCDADGFIHYDEEVEFERTRQLLKGVVVPLIGPEKRSHPVPPGGSGGKWKAWLGRLGLSR